ncbi:MAG: bifunctional adenosylcobinamide kinase/adenosylcobinamide-phosphate guanylyltransferase [Zoogloeaceae bacterium]|nr:bifunctional adenosylcobinamide kinase/adenosylcobinamide-phosphate guanylyltransferase [Zoogloeaceae bacterium]
MAAEFIIGGARSGKSRYAEQRARAAETDGMRVIYIATATAGDEEMTRRIAHHRMNRPAHWQTREEPLHLARRLQAEAAPDACLLVDCLTLWLANLVFTPADHTTENALLQAETRLLVETLPQLPGRVILVSNEVGWGIVPADPLSRFFTDEQGWLNQRVAAVCEQVTLVAAGLPLRLK